MNAIITSLLFMAQLVAFFLPEKEVERLKMPRVKLQTAITRGPYLQVATPNSMTVRWRTNVKERSLVTYGLNSNQLNKKVDDRKSITEHIVKLGKLKPGTKYYYSVGNFKGYFYTLPPKGSEGLLRIAALGDCGNNSLNQRNVRDQLIRYLGKNDLNAWILLGDNAYVDGTDAEFQSKFFDIYKDNLLPKYPLFPSPGNHDYHKFTSSSAKGQDKIAYFQNFSMPVNGEAGGVPSKTKSYYSFDVGNVHFLSLDSYGPDFKGKYLFDKKGQQMDWVKKDLKANKSKWVVAYWHHPPYTMGSHSSDTESLLVKIRRNVIQTLEDFGVDVVLCGHSHVYERSKLMKGYYGKEADFSASIYNLSNSSGLDDGSKNSSPYIKNSSDNKGTVYVVSGSAGALGGHVPAWPHNAMYYSNDTVGGSVMMEVQGNRFTLKWICADGQIRDKFTILKYVKK